jgi:hypothetical protein
MSQVVKCLVCKYKALSSHPNNNDNKKIRKKIKETLKYNWENNESWPDILGAWVAFGYYKHCCDECGCSHFFLILSILWNRYLQVELLSYMVT